MRLLDAILETNRRRVAGDTSAALPPEALEGGAFAALTCIDPRLNRLLPEHLGLPDAQFVWLRNAGNIISGPLSSTMRSLALACAVKGAKEIAVMGHTDCQVCKTSMLQLLEKLNDLGVDRHRLPENLVDYFGLFSSERQNVIKAADTVRASPLIGARIPVHGLLIDIQTGAIECVVNGYAAAEAAAAAGAGAGAVPPMQSKIDRGLEALGRIGQAVAEELPRGGEKIGEFVSNAQSLARKAEELAGQLMPKPKPGAPTAARETGTSKAAGERRSTTPRDGGAAGGKL
jgi:carbonic anhydrase